MDIQHAKRPRGSRTREELGEVHISSEQRVGKLQEKRRRTQEHLPKLQRSTTHLQIDVPRTLLCLLIAASLLSGIHPVRAIGGGIIIGGGTNSYFIVRCSENQAHSSTPTCSAWPECHCPGGDDTEEFNWQYELSGGMTACCYGDVTGEGVSPGETTIVTTQSGPSSYEYFITCVTELLCRDLIATA